MSEAFVLYTEPYICSFICTLHLSLKTSQHLRPQQGNAVEMSLWSDHDLAVSTPMAKTQPQILEEYLKSWVILCAVIFYVSAVVILGINED